MATCDVAMQRKERMWVVMDGMMECETACTIQLSDARFVLHPGERRPLLWPLEQQLQSMLRIKFCQKNLEYLEYGLPADQRERDLSKNIQSPGGQKDSYKNNHSPGL